MTLIDRRTLLATGIATGIAAGVGAAAGTALAAGPDTAVRVDTFGYARPAGTDAPLLLDFYRPAGARGPLPVIVFCHGGAWVFGTRRSAPDLKRYFAAQGFAMASIDYRLLPGTPFPGAVEDVRTAVRWLRANAARLRLDPNRIGLWGTSAGAHLASMAGLLPPDLYAGTELRDQSSAVACVLDGYGPTDLSLMPAQLAAEKPTLEPLASGLAALPNTAIEDVRTATAAQLATLKQGSTAYLRGDGDLAGRVRAADPATYAHAGAPPFLIMHGLADGTVPHGQSVHLCDALAKADADVTLRLVHGVAHTFFNLPGIDEVAGPFRMEVDRHRPGMAATRAVETRRLFDVAHDFFRARLT